MALSIIINGRVCYVCCDFYKIKDLVPALALAPAASRAFAPVLALAPARAFAPVLALALSGTLSVAPARALALVVERSNAN